MKIRVLHQYIESIHKYKENYLKKSWKIETENAALMWTGIQWYRVLRKNDFEV